ncbi:hypothetical protein HNO89_001816 [Sporosarcina luteola]|nr:hypothetical protein [Sporosarcina luteola]
MVFPDPKYSQQLKHMPKAEKQELILLRPAFSIAEILTKKMRIGVITRHRICFLGVVIEWE